MEQVSNIQSLRERILAKNDLRRVAFFVEEWQETVYLQDFTQREWEQIATKFQEGDNLGANRFLVAHCVVEESGRKVFDGPDDIEALGDKNRNAITAIVDKILELNGLRPESTEDAKKN